MDSDSKLMAACAHVDGKPVVIYDDMIRTGSSVINAARAYRDAGATSVAALCTHGVFPADLHSDSPRIALQHIH